jgi:hypothetical protein
MDGALSETGPGRAAVAGCLTQAGILAACIALAWACGGKPPEMPAVEWRLEQRPSPSGPYESLWVFASVKDSEGIDDIDSLYVVNDKAAIDWRLTNANWIKRTEGGDSWIGGAGLAMNDYGPIPRGTYRAVTVNAAGEQAEKSFPVDGDFPSYGAPRLELSKRSLSLRSSWPETLVLGFDGTGALIGTSSWTGVAGDLADFFGSDVAARLAALQVYGYEPSLRMGAYSERMAVK